MSLHLYEDQRKLSKREKQESFRKSLDDQLRLKQEAASQPGGVVAGLNVPDVNRRMDRHQQQESSKASGSDGSFSPKEKQPYMSALSEMNGRSRLERQHQFEKETCYRNMLRDQIEENRRRKEGEKAKIEEGKRRELEEIRHLQEDSVPRRRELTQFQASSDHPLPSRGRLPPARHHPRDEGEAYGQEGESAPAYESLQGRMSTVTGKRDAERDGRAREGIPSGDLYDNRAGQPRGSDMQPRERKAAGHIPEKHLHAEIHAPYGRSTASHGVSEGDLSSNRLETERVDSIVRKAVLDDRAVRDDDVVSRADFDELSNLCRDLLLEQKKLRRKLEEREEEEYRSQRRSGESRRKGLGPARPGARSAWDVRQRGVQEETRVKGIGKRESCMRRDSRDKPRVAFGSTVPRSGSGQLHPEDRPLATASSAQVSRRGRDPRVSKSELRSRPDEVGVQYSSSRNAASMNGRESLANTLESDWRRPLGGTARRPLVDQDHSPTGCISGEEQGHGAHRSQNLKMGDRGSIQALLGRSPSRQFSSGYEAGGCNEAGHESTFLPANPF